MNQQGDKLWGDQSRPTPEDVKAFKRLMNGLRRRWKLAIDAGRNRKSDSGNELHTAASNPIGVEDQPAARSCSRYRLLDNLPAQVISHGCMITRGLMYTLLRESGCSHVYLVTTLVLFFISWPTFLHLELVHVLRYTKMALWLRQKARRRIKDNPLLLIALVVITTVA